MPDTLSRNVGPRLLQLGLLAAITVVAIFGVIRPAVGPGGLGLGHGPTFGAPPCIDVTLDVSAVKITTDPPFPALYGIVTPGNGLEVLTPTGSRVCIYEPDFRQQAAFVATPVLAGLISIVILVLLLQITSTLRAGDPFRLVNAHRLYLIAALIGIGGQLTVLAAAWGRAGVLNNPRVAPYVERHVHITLLPLLAGFAVAVAAEIFRQGAQMRADLEGLV